MKRREIAELIRRPRCNGRAGARRCALAEHHAPPCSSKPTATTVMVGPIAIVSRS